MAANIRKKTKKALRECRPRPSRTPDLFEYPLAPFIVIGSATPIVFSWIVLAMSYSLHWEHIKNVTSCATMEGFLPAASWPIGIYEPQRYVWMIGIIIHFPFAIFHGFIFRDFFLSSDSPYVSKSWYRFFAHCLPWWNMLEMYGLAFTSIVNVEQFFYVHVVTATMWMFGMCAYIWNHTFLHHYSGWRYENRMTRILFWVKLIFLLTAMILSISSAFTYPYYTAYCDIYAYHMFGFAEYIVGHLQGTMHLLHLFELRHARFGMFVIHDERSLPAPAIVAHDEHSQNHSDSQDLLSKRTHRTQVIR